MPSRALARPARPLPPVATPALPAGWPLLAQALGQRRPVAARYHGHPRLLCPHAIGWQHSRAKVLCYQAAGTTSTGPLPPNPAHRWRLMFIDELTDLRFTNDPWQTANNYSPTSHGIDQLILAITIHDPAR